MGYLKARFISFAMVGGVCFMLIVSLTVTVAIKALSQDAERSHAGRDAVISTLITLVAQRRLSSRRFLP